jgi:hypothetical protein
LILCSQFGYSFSCLPSPAFALDGYDAFAPDPHNDDENEDRSETPFPSLEKATYQGNHDGYDAFAPDPNSDYDAFAPVPHDDDENEDRSETPFPSLEKATYQGNQENTNGEQSSVTGNIWFLCSQFRYSF